MTRSPRPRHALFALMLALPCPACAATVSPDRLPLLIAGNAVGVVGDEIGKK